MMFNTPPPGTCTGSSKALEGGQGNAVPARSADHPDRGRRGFRPARAVVGRHRGAGDLAHQLLHAPVTTAISTARAVANPVTALESAIAWRMSSGSGARPSPSPGRASATPP